MPDLKNTWEAVLDTAWEVVMPTSIMNAVQWKGIDWVWILLDASTVIPIAGPILKWAKAGKKISKITKMNEAKKTVPINQTRTIEQPKNVNTATPEKTAPINQTRTAEQPKNTKNNKINKLKNKGQAIIDKIDKNKIKEIVGTELTNKLDNLKKWLWVIKWKINVDSFKSIVKRNKLLTAGAIVTWLWLTIGGIFTPEEQEELNENINTWTWNINSNNNSIISSQTDVNPTHANKESTKLLNWTIQDLNNISKEIKNKLQSWNMTKQEAKGVLTTVKEFANFNFETSIVDNLKMKWLDWSFQTRWILANKLWIEWYSWSYNQNIQMLNTIKYLDHKEIQDLLSK